MSDEKKVVLITGGAMGQGRAHAVKYAENGFNVVLADMLDPEDERFQETIRELKVLGAEVLAKKQTSAARQIWKACLQRHGRNSDVWTL